MGVERSADLATLTEGLSNAAVSGDEHARVFGVETDSRRVRRGALFVALRGTHEDGRAFVADAVANGARVVVLEGAFDATPFPNVTFVHVPDSRRALSSIASAFYADPSRVLDVIGVTGTNGKTSTTRMIAAILNAAKTPCGVIGTVGATFDEQTWQLENTTPLPHELHALLAAMRDAGARAVAMEVSSHALALDRVADVRFDVAALTNVTRDHLDFHQTLDAYAAAKRRLFDFAPRGVFNADDTYGARWAAELRAAGCETIEYGTSPRATLVPEAIAVEPEGSRFTLDGTRFELHVSGRFNIWNALAAIGAARFCGVDDATSARGLASLERVPGRMEHVGNGNIDVVVDYAHTPDALEHALQALRETVKHRLVVVFGCGGDRDRGKRPEMGAIAARLADRIYVTSDNPRSEDPQAIADAIVAGIGARPHIVELDRRRAIERAIAEAQTGDVVLVAGKGHESYQIIGDRVLSFDDAAVAREILPR